MADLILKGRGLSEIFLIIILRYLIAALMTWLMDPPKCTRLFGAGLLT